MLFVPERRQSRRTRDVRAADLQEEMAEQRSSVPPASTKTAAPQRTSQRAAASNQTERDPQRAERAIEPRIARRRAEEKRGDTLLRPRATTK